MSDRKIVFIFLCDNRTETECLERKLVGTKGPDWGKGFRDKISLGDLLILYNYESYCFYGMFTAIDIGTNIQKDAWSKEFPCQVETDNRGEILKLALDDFLARTNIPASYLLKPERENKPPYCLEGDYAQQCLNAFGNDYEV